MSGRAKLAFPAATRPRKAIVRATNPIRKFQVIETSIEPESLPMFELPAGCQPARRPPANGRITSARVCGVSKFGETTSTVATTASTAPMMRKMLSACLKGTPIPRRSQTTPEMTMPEMRAVWKVATPSAPTEMPSESTITAPHRPAKKFGHGIVPRRRCPGSDRKACLVEGRGRMITSISTRPDPKLTIAAR